MVTYKEIYIHIDSIVGKTNIFYDTDNDKYFHTYGQCVPQTGHSMNSSITGIRINIYLADTVIASSDRFYGLNISKSEYDNLREERNQLRDFIQNLGHLKYVAGKKEIQRIDVILSEYESGLRGNFPGLSMEFINQFCNNKTTSHLTGKIKYVNNILYVDDLNNTEIKIHKRSYSPTQVRKLLEQCWEDAIIFQEQTTRIELGPSYIDKPTILSKSEWINKNML